MGERAGHDEPTAQIVLDANGVDELELVRIGALSERVLHRHLSGAPTVTLCDEENTPLAEVSLQGTRHLRPLAVGVGEAWHPNIRIASVDALTLGDLPFGFVAFQPPSLAEIAATASRARALGSDAILLFAAVSRATRPDGEVGPSGLVRAVDGAAERVGADTLLSQIVEMVAKAQRSRAPIQGLADRVFVTVPATFGSSAQVNEGRISVRLKRWEDRDKTAQEIIRALTPKLRENPWIQAVALNPPGLGQRGSRTPVQFVIASSTYEELVALRDRILREEIGRAHV